jgi:tRNA (Thr-GGU) A37 N-methylase
VSKKILRQPVSATDESLRPHNAEVPTQRVSKIEAGKLEVEWIDMDLRGTVLDVARLLAFEAREKDWNSSLTSIHPFPCG